MSQNGNSTVLVTIQVKKQLARIFDTDGDTTDLLEEIQALHSQRGSETPLDIERESHEFMCDTLCVRTDAPDILEDMVRKAAETRNVTISSIKQGQPDTAGKTATLTIVPSPADGAMG